jgi:predicted membrane-bound mannosyltransferase
MNLKAFDLSHKPYWIIAGVVLIGFALRLHVVLGSVYDFDEAREWIPFARSISLKPGEVNLPVRVISHPILPAYLIKVGSLIGGENPFGFRLMSLLAGTATLLVIALAALRWRGFWTAFWATSLIAFNEYHIYVSSLAIDKPFQLFFSAVAIASFLRFLQTEKVGALYLAGAMTGIAFLCKETTGLLLPGFFFALLLSRRHRQWLLRPAPYIALLLSAVVISPDILANVFLADQLNFTYSDHLHRAARIGFTRHHLLFFLRDVFVAVYRFLGRPLWFNTPAEYAAMNSLIGAMFLGVATWVGLRLIASRQARSESVNLYLAIAFWSVFGFFLFTEVNTNVRLAYLTYTAWFWSDLTLMPAALMTGAVLTSLPSTWRVPACAIAGAGVLFAIGAATLTRVGRASGPVVGFNPEYILPSDGRLVKVKAVFNYCMICEKDMTPKLVDVKLRFPCAVKNQSPDDCVKAGDDSRTSVLGTDAARVAEGSTDGTDLVVRARDADPAQNPKERWYERMWYEISYSLTDRDGQKHVVQDKVQSPLRPEEFGTRFWTGEPYAIGHQTTWSDLMQRMRKSIQR